MLQLLTILTLTFSLLFSASESSPLQERFEQLLQSILLKDTSETDLKESALIQDIPLEHWQLNVVGPYCSAGRLMVPDEDGDHKGCTAFLIAKNHALTARHCVQKQREGAHAWRSAKTRPLNDLKLCLRRNCNFPGRCLNATKVRVSKTLADYALITYRESSYCTHWLRYLDGSSWSGPGVELFGYPNYPPTSPGNPTNCPYDPFFHSVCDSSQMNGDNELSYECESLHGMSGSPVSVPSESGVYGVHTRLNSITGKGYGVLITEDRYCVIAACINEDGNADFGGNKCSYRSCKLQ